MKRFISLIIVFSSIFLACSIFSSCEKGPNGVIVNLPSSSQTMPAVQEESKAEVEEISRKEISRANITLIEYKATDVNKKVYSFTVQLNKVKYSVEKHESNIGFFRIEKSDDIGIEIEVYVINENNDAIYYGGMPDPGSITVVDENGRSRTYEDNLLHHKLYSNKIAPVLEGYDCIDHPGEYQGYITMNVYDNKSKYIANTNIPITIYAY